MAGHLFILSAPSGSGKSTLVSQLRSMVHDLDFSVSWTTRAPRGSEQDGREYHFTSRENFQRMVDAGEFLEHADVFGNCYGTARNSLQEAALHGRDLLLDIDVQGAAQVRRNMPGAISIFILPPNPQALETRLRNRSRAEGGVPESIVQKRLAEARREIPYYREYDYILVNDILVEAVKALVAVVIYERLKEQTSLEDHPEFVEARALAGQYRTGNSTERLRPVLASFGISM